MLAGCKLKKGVIMIWFLLEQLSYEWFWFDFEKLTYWKVVLCQIPLLHFIVCIRISKLNWHVIKLNAILILFKIHDAAVGISETTNRCYLLETTVLIRIRKWRWYSANSNCQNKNTYLIYIYRLTSKIFITCNNFQFEVR